MSAMELIPMNAEQVLDRWWRAADLDTLSKVFVVLDGARDPRIYRTVQRGDLAYACLYRGLVPPLIAEVAPYLVELRRNAETTRELITWGWGNSWGTFVSTIVSIEALRRHLRRFLQVKGEDGRRLLFRYYDPRVLRAYLPTCTRQELNTFFGPVEAFMVEEQGGAASIELFLGPDGLEHEITALR